MQIKYLITGKLEILSFRGFWYLQATEIDRIGAKRGQCRVTSALGYHCVALLKLIKTVHSVYTHNAHYHFRWTFFPTFYSSITRPALFDHINCTWDLRFSFVESQTDCFKVCQPRTYLML